MRRGSADTMVRILLLLSLCAFVSHAAVLPGKNITAASEQEIKPEHAHLLSGQALVDYVNKNQKFFKAELAPHGFQYRLMDLMFISQNENSIPEAMTGSNSDIPESFDARTQWPECPSTKYIRDQANCGSCWAVSSAAAMSDRVCIATKGQKKVELSADDILSCCPDCGYGCHGGYIPRAWSFFAKTGVVSGGNYGTEDACRPYEIHPCGKKYGPCFSIAGTPKCIKKCQDGYNVTYEEDKTFGRTAYRVPSSVEAIQRDIMKNGPIVAAYTVYADFVHYKSGIYKHTAGSPAGGHAVKIIGWGEENGVPYWLIANSWNENWGEHGYFRMIRGVNNCGIESNVFAGLV